MRRRPPPPRAPRLARARAPGPHAIRKGTRISRTGMPASVHPWWHRSRAPASGLATSRNRWEPAVIQSSGHSVVEHPDPITIEVLRGALDALADEMELVLLRSSHSTVINEALDATSAIFDAQGRTVAQAVSLPVISGCWSRSGSESPLDSPMAKLERRSLHLQRPLRRRDTPPPRGAAGRAPRPVGRLRGDDEPPRRRGRAGTRQPRRRGA